MHRFATTWKLAKASWRVLMHDKELVALPAISGVVTILVALTFVAPIVAAGNLEEPGPLHYVMLGLFYFTAAYITIFFNTALVVAADDRLNGGDPTIGSAVSGALNLAGRILPWALLSATVSLIIQAIEERAGWLGRLIAGLVGLAWTLVTFLVLPVLVIEGGSAVEAVKRSAELFKETWGENMIANVGFGILAGVAMIPAFLLVALGVLGGESLALLAFGLAVVWVIGVVVVTNALSGIYQTALYHYATTGQSPSTAFSNADFAGAFTARR